MFAARRCVCDKPKADCKQEAALWPGSTCPAVSGERMDLTIMGVPLLSVRNEPNTYEK